MKRLIACRNRLYRETGTYPNDLGAALARAAAGAKASSSTASFE
jgi:hypothetical protein